MPRSKNELNPQAQNEWPQSLGCSAASPSIEDHAELVYEADGDPDGGVPLNLPPPRPEPTAQTTLPASVPASSSFQLRDIVVEPCGHILVDAGLPAFNKVNRTFGCDHCEREYLNQIDIPMVGASQPMRHPRPAHDLQLQQWIDNCQSRLQELGLKIQREKHFAPGASILSAGLSVTRRSGPAPDSMSAKAKGKMKVPSKPDESWVSDHVQGKPRLLMLHNCYAPLDIRQYMIDQGWHEGFGLVPEAIAEIVSDWPDPRSNRDRRCLGLHKDAVKKSCAVPICSMGAELRIPVAFVSKGFIRHANSGTGDGESQSVDASSAPTSPHLEEELSIQTIHALEEADEDIRAQLEQLGIGQSVDGDEDMDDHMYRALNDPITEEELAAARVEAGGPWL